MDLLGKPPFNPPIFYSGKIIGYILWMLYFLNISGIIAIEGEYSVLQRNLSMALMTLGTVIISLGLYFLGMSTRYGLPTDKTTLKTAGIYWWSRNPIYLGIDILTIAAMIYFFNLYMLLAGLYSIVVYHYIILAEERFLEERFGENYLRYKGSARRYL